MRFALFFLISLAVTATGLAQEPEFYHNKDLLHLKNGSIIRGMILEDNDSIVRIRTRDGSQWVFEASEKLKIEQGRKRPNFSSNGYQAFLEGSLFFGDADYSFVQGGFSTTHGRRYKDVWYGGLGTGIENFDQAIVPLFADIRYSLSKTTVRPIVYTRLGYAWQIDEGFGSIEYHGGIMSEVGLGIQRHFGHAFGITMNMGYRHQQLAYTSTNDWTGAVSEVNEISNRIAFRFGITF